MVSAARRRLLQAACALALPGLPALARRTPPAHIVVAGGGFAGASCALTLKRLAPALSVRLIDPAPEAITGPMSNAMLVGLRPRAAVTRRLSGLRACGIDVIRAQVDAIAPEQRRVRTTDGSWHPGDRLVLAPGIGLRWDTIEGLDAQSSLQMPHAWLGDASALAFRKRFAALRDGSVLVIVAPPNPYRCPPGPYERASLCAWALQQRQRGCKIIIADAKDDFSKRALFQLAWDMHYPGMIEWLPRHAGGEVVMIEPDARSLTLAGGERLRADLICAIPAQRAHPLCEQAGLSDETGWCPVNGDDFQSLRHAGVHVLGDASLAHPMPKSAFSANSQGKLCALAILAELSGQAAPSARLANTCYSLIRPDQAVSVSGLYGSAGGRLSALTESTSPLGANDSVRAREAIDAWHGYRSLLAESFAQH